MQDNSLKQNYNSIKYANNIYFTFIINIKKLKKKER